ncbi:unnamed protein product, partial [Pylaiella littoralis]
MASQLEVCRNSGIRHDALLDWTHIRPPSEAQELLLSGRAGMQKKAKMYSIQSCEWGDTYIDLFKSLPLQWSATRLPDTSMVFSR